MKRLFFAVGGTGGHLFPAQILAKEMLEKWPNCSIWLMGRGLKSSSYIWDEILHSPNVHLIEIPSAGLSKNPLKMLRSLGLLFLGTLRALFWIVKIKPHSITGFGSFYSAPTLLAGVISRTPIYLYECDLKPGVTSRLFYPFAKAVGLCFARQALPKRGTVVEPLILKEEVEKKKAYAYFGLSSKKKTLLILGGSQGAVFINELMVSALAKMSSWTKSWQFVHLVGKSSSCEAVKKAYDQVGIKSCVREFETRMPLALAIADLAICRAGSGTVLELVEAEVPSLLIPYPHAYNHQMLNALFMKSIGAASVMKQSDGNIEVFLGRVEKVRDEKARMQMKDAIKKHKKKREGIRFADCISDSLTVSSK